MEDTRCAGEIVPDVDELVAPVTFDLSCTDPLDVEAKVSGTEAAAGKLFGRLKAERQSSPKGNPSSYELQQMTK